MAWTPPRPDWRDFPDKSTPVRSTDIEAWQEGIQSAHEYIDALLARVAALENGEPPPVTTGYPAVYAATY